MPPPLWRRTHEGASASTLVDALSVTVSPGNVDERHDAIPSVPEVVFLRLGERVMEPSGHAPRLASTKWPAAVDTPTPHSRSPGGGSTGPPPGASSCTARHCATAPRPGIASNTVASAEEASVSMPSPKPTSTGSMMLR